MKNIILKILKYLLIIVIIGIFINSYMKGIFHPKSFILDGIKINAPKNTYLYQVELNGEIKQDIFSPIKLSKFSKYQLSKDDKEIDILFFNPRNNKLLNIIGKKSNQILFEKYILEFQKIEPLTVEPKSYKYCKKIYQYEDKSNKSFLFFNNQKHIRFILFSNCDGCMNTIQTLCE